MNIRSVGPNLTPLEIKKPEVSKETKLDSSQERDAQVFYQNGKEQERRKLTEEELQEAMKHLQGLPFVKDNNWAIRLERVGEIVTVFVEDNTGKIIRRIPEQDLWGLISQQNNDQNKGNLFNKAI